MNATSFHAVLGSLLLLVLGQGLPGRAADVDPGSLVPIIGQTVRVWQDDSGYHTVRGTLIAVSEQAVRLLKENQRVTTVPLTRLSQPDLQHVNTIITATASNIAREEEVGGAADLTAARDSRFDHPVATITLSREFLRRFVQNVDQRQVLSTNILGVPIQGWSHTTASADLVLIPHPSQAVLEIPVRGQVVSQTVGHASLAQIHSESLTDFEKSVRVNLAEAGVSVEPLELSTINRFINSNVTTSARALSKLVNRIANRRVRANKPVADQIARQQERHRINSAFESVAQDSVEKLNRMLRNFVETSGDSPLVRDSKLGFSTTQAALKVDVAIDDTPAELPPPPQPDQDMPLVLQVHASVFVRAAESDAATEMTERLQQIGGSESPMLDAIRREIEGGKFTTRWTDDESWLTITWQPQDELGAVDRSKAIADVR